MFFFCGSLSESYSCAKPDHGVEKENDGAGAGARREGSEKNCLQSTP